MGKHRAPEGPSRWQRLLRLDDPEKTWEIMDCDRTAPDPRCQPPEEEPDDWDGHPFSGLYMGRGGQRM